MPATVNFFNLDINAIHSAEYDVARINECWHITLTVQRTQIKHQDEEVFYLLREAGEDGEGDNNAEFLALAQNDYDLCRGYPDREIALSFMREAMTGKRW